MMMRGLILACIIQLFITDKVKCVNRRADLFNLDSFKQYENVPDNVRISATFRSPDGSFAASTRRGTVTDTHSCDRITSVPRDLTFITRYGFYGRYTHAYGIPVISSTRVTDKALKRACNIIRFLLADRRDVRQSLYRHFGRFAVIAINEQTTTIPEFSHLPAWWNTRARGLGGVLGRPMSCAGEENLLCLARDRYRGDDIFFHESAHNIAEVALKGGGIPGFYTRLVYAYNSALRSGKLRGTYSATDSREYWAEGLQSFFANHPDANPPDGTHNYVNTRAELYGHDRGLYDLIREAYPCMNIYTTCSDNFLKTMKMNCNEKTTLPPTPFTGTTIEPLPTKCVTTWETQASRDANCNDNNKHCQSWASRGECTKNPTWMNENCCKSCSSSGSCKDLDRSCSAWTNAGYCSRNSVKKLCKKSCKLCSGKKKVIKCHVITTVSPVKTTVSPVITTTEDPTVTLVPPPIPHACNTTVAAGFESNKFPDTSIKASTSESKWHAPGQARLNLQESDKGVGAWCAGVQNKNQYLEIDFGTEQTINKLSIQGRESKYPKYVKKFTIEMKNDGEKQWRFYANKIDYNTPEIFVGNTDMKTVKSIDLPDRITARYFRVKPTEWENMICMRMEVYYCK